MCFAQQWDGGGPAEVKGKGVGWLAAMMINLHTEWSFPPTRSMAATGRDANPYLKSMTPCPKMRKVCLRKSVKGNLAFTIRVHFDPLQSAAGPNAPNSRQWISDADELSNNRLKIISFLSFYHHYYYYCHLLSFIVTINKSR